MSASLSSTVAVILYALSGLVGVCIGLDKTVWVAGVLLAAIGVALAAFRPVWSLYLAVMLIPMEGAGRILPGISSLTYAKVALVVCLMGAVLQLLTRRADLALPARASALAVAIGAALTGSALHWSRDALQGLVSFVGQVLLVLLCTQLIRTRSQFRGLARSVVLGSLPVVVIGVIESVTHASVLGTAQAQLYGDAYLGVQRITSTFYDPNALGRYLLFALTATVGLAHLESSRSARVVAMAVASSQVYCMVFTFSRGTFVGLAFVALVYLAWQRGISRRFAASLGIASVSLTLALTTGQLLASLGDRFVEGGSLLTAGTTRLAIWQSAAAAVLTSPVFGFGPGGVIDAIGRLTGATYSPHNTFAEALLAVGAVGTVALTLFVWAETRDSMLGRNLGMMNESSLAILSLLGVLTSGMFLHNFQSNELWLSLGMLSIVGRWSRSEKSLSPSA